MPKSRPAGLIAGVKMGRGHEVATIPTDEHKNYVMEDVYVEDTAKEEEESIQCSSRCCFTISVIWLERHAILKQYLSASFEGSEKSRSYCISYDFGTQSAQP